MDQVAHRHHAPGWLVPRIAVGGISHETNTFSPARTTLDAFRRRSLLLGEPILRQSRQGRGALGGMVEAAASSVTLLPTLFASAPPGGLVTADAFAHLRGLLLDCLRPTAHAPWGPPLDGVILTLHGAMVAEGEDDCEGAILRDVRNLVGRDTPIFAVLDSHANVTLMMVAHADLLLTYQTYPHIDLYERGREALLRLLDLHHGRISPSSAFRAVPLLIPLPAQRTDGSGPMREALALAREMEARSDVVSVSVAGGFPYSDIPHAGASLIVTTDGDRPLAEELAGELAAAIWNRRPAFRATGLPPDAAIDQALALGRSPVILADVADNPGAGAPGDGTRLLARLIERGVSGAVVGALPDPAAVAAAIHAGTGNTVRLLIGGNVDPHRRSGPPLDLTCRVNAITDGVFRLSGPMGRGVIARMGRTAVLAIDGVEIVVCEQPVQTIDPALLESVGIEVEAGGLSGSDLDAFPYRRVRRPIAPLDREVRYLD